MSETATRRTVEIEVGDREIGHGPRVRAETGHKIFIEATWSGRLQQIPVDPLEVAALIDALSVAAEVSRG